MPSDRSTDSFVEQHDSAAVATATDETAARDIKKFRQSKRESQEKFWSRFGVTQSSGSRFETGMLVPLPVALLLKLYMNGTLSDTDLLG